MTDPNAHRVELEREQRIVSEAMRERRQETPRSHKIVDDYLALCDLVLPDGGTCEDIERDLLWPIQALERELIAAQATIAAQNQEIERLQEALGILREWYMRDGSVGGASLAFEAAHRVLMPSRDGAVGSP